MSEAPATIDTLQLRDDGGNIDPHKVANAISVAGERYSDLYRAAKLLEKTEKAVLARLTIPFRAQGLSMREAEMNAMATEEWENHTYATIEARYAANLARVRFEAVKALFEASRTTESTRRAEISAFGRR